MGAYKGKASTFKEADEKTSGFKRGGKTDKSEKKEDASDRPARKSGGSVFSSAASGKPRGSASHY